MHPRRLTAVVVLAALGCAVGSLRAAERPHPVFYRAVNINGPALTIDGQQWEAGSASPRGYENGDRPFENQSVPLVPATDDARAKMIRSSTYTPNGRNRVAMSALPEGEYSVYLYVWEDNDAQRFDLSVNGRVVEKGVVSGAAGEWKRLGPWVARAVNGRIEVTSEGGHANMSGLELWRGAFDVPVPAKRVVNAAAREHWSFQARGGGREVTPPQVRDAAWAFNDIDRFILAELEKRKLQPVGDADRRTLIRRATFDLLGLPPTPEEIDAFVKDQSPDAWAKVIDRLLDSPHYGERWGRHWMDLVRYADTAGDNSDYPIPQAYLYRNYIIDAFNKDKPYDRFVREQLAGDLMPYDTWDQRNEQVIATGYIAMSRRFGSVVDRYPQHQTIEDTIDNMGKTFFGLTIACARCHDHKFDPISTDDYYGIYGFFSSTVYPFPGIELLKTQKDFVPLVAPTESEAAMQPFREKERELEAKHQRLLEQRAALEKKNEQLKEELSKTQDAEKRKALLAQIVEVDAEVVRVRTAKTAAGRALDQHRLKMPRVKDAYAVHDGGIGDARVQIMGQPDRLGATAPRGFLDVLGGQKLPADVASKSSGRLQLADWIADPTNPLTARVMVNRIWQYHFGRGLVSTPSDFGTRGLPPSHPDLLDWLANRFISEGWSIKQMHRLIMTSHTYRLASHGDEARVAANDRIDPDNVYHWRADRHRLDAETLRDTLLMIAGNLDAEPMNQPHPFPAMDKWEFTQHHPFKDVYPSNKRSVYLMTKRLTAMSYFTTFDGADSNATTTRRDESVTAVQALWLLNDAFIHEQAAALAQRLAREHGDETDRLNALFTVTLGRPPSDQERQDAQTYLKQAAQVAGDGDKGHAEAWTSFVRVLLRVNEFLYID